MRYVSLAVFFALTFAAALTGGLFKPGAWYAGLAKPSWTPPNWLFAPAWTVLYIMIAVAGWRIWEAGHRGPALWLWIGGLIVNALWSYLFFGLQKPGIAFVDLVAMWLSIVAFIVIARGVDTTASLLFVPYLAWVTFAGALNFAIWRLNS